MEAVLPPAHAVKRASGFLIFLGILLLILGFMSIGSPLYTGIAVDVIVAVLLIVGGIFRLVLAFRAGSWGSGLLAVIVALATLACGILMLVRPMIGLTALTLLIAVYFLVEGVFEIALSFSWKPIKGWGWALFSGLTSLALGALIWMQWPVSGVWAIGILVGVNLIMVGISLMSLGFAGRGVLSAIPAAA